VGDVLVKNGDIFGDGVNIAARLEALADVGGICVTRGVRDHLRDRVDAAFEDLGEQSVKNIGRPVRVFRVVFDPQGEPLLEIGRTDVEGSGVASVEVSLSQSGNSGEDQNRVEVAFWESVQESDDPTEYAIYLERFPDGRFVDLAEVRISSYSNSKYDPEVEVAYWETVRNSDNAAMVKAYLNKYPNGQFIELARLILDDINGKARK
jgi:hypothetical protein